MKRAATTRCSVGARSELGYVRGDNQDRMSRLQVGERIALIVSDGMGGQRGGSAAAELTVRILERHLSSMPDAASVEQTLRRAFAAANHEVYTLGCERYPGTAGMGATAVLCLVARSCARVAHVGDSRAYLVRQGRLKRLTRDHTRAQLLVDAGVLSAREAEMHPDANILARAIGHHATVEVDIGGWIQLRQGDEILLCSDGLYGEVEDPEIERILRHDASPQGLVDRLVDSALERGGRDNVTVQLIRYGDRSSPCDLAPLPHPMMY
jgi:serine/threonine protein phosphatase PrpC